MDINIHNTFLPHDDADAALFFWRDTLGFELRNDVGYEGMRWLTIGPAGQPDVSIVLYPVDGDPSMSEEERRTIRQMMAKGTFAMVVLATDDLDGLFMRMQTADVEVMQEPVEQPYGVRDCAFRDSAGNAVRIQERT